MCQRFGNVRQVLHGITGRIPCSTAVFVGLQSCATRIIMIGELKVSQQKVAVGRGRSVHIWFDRIPSVQI